jgi:hypothetical protein
MKLIPTQRKRNSWFVTVESLAIALAMFVGVFAPTAAPADGQSAEASSFKAVAAHLDPGGNFFLYLSTEQWLTGLSDKIAGFQQIFEGLPMGGQERAEVGRVIDLVTSLVKHSGVEDISGVGMSSLATEKGLYRNKSILHHYEGKDTGFLWSLFGKKPHALAGLNFLPETTAVAGFGDLNLPLLWKALQEESSRAGIKEVEQFFREFPAIFESHVGLKFDDVVNSLGNEYGVVLTLDEKKQVALPFPPGGLEIPEPGLMLVVKVKDNLVFDRVDQLLKQDQNLSSMVTSVNKEGLKMRTLTMPLPLPLPLRITLARSGDYLFLATTDSLIEEALAIQKGEKPGFKGTEEFKRLAKGLPEQGNQFLVLSKKFGETIVRLQTSVLKSNPMLSGDAKTWLQTMLNGGAVATAFNVSSVTEEGWVSVGNGSKDLRAAVLMPLAVVPVGMMAAIAVPNFVRARSMAQSNVCINNLKQLDGAKEQWALENKKKDGDEVKMSDLVPSYIKSEPRCPAGGGSYILNAVGTNPACPNCNPNNPELSRHKLNLN